MFDRLPGEAALNVDETGHTENRQKFWTWCFRAQLFTLFRIDKSRGSEVLIEVLGTEFNGVLGCDYFSAYRKYMRKFGVRVQFCMAHLIRDVKFLLTLPGAADRAYGRRLCDRLRELFAVIHRREQMSRAAFRKALDTARRRVLWAATTDVPHTQTCPEPGRTLSQARRSLFPLHHHAGHRADQQPGRTGDSLRGDRPADYSRDAERERPPLVRAHLDGDRHLRPARSRRSSSSCWIRSKPISPALRRLRSCRQAPEQLPPALSNLPAAVRHSVTVNGYYNSTSA